MFGAPVTAWAALALLFAVTLLSYTDRFVFNLLADFVRADLRITDSQIGLIQGTAFAVSYSTAALALVRWADQLPGRALLIGGLIIWSAGTVLCGLARSFETMFAARMVVGFGEAALFPATIPMVARLFPANRRGLAISILIIGSIAASGIALVISGTLLQALQAMVAEGYLHPGSFGLWRFVLIALGVPVALFVPLILLIPRAASTREQASLETSAGPDTQGRTIVAWILLGLTLWALVDYGLNAWLPTDLMRSFASTPTQLSHELGTAAVVAGVLGPLLGGFLGDRMLQAGVRAARPLLGVVCAYLAVPLVFLSLASSLYVRIGLFGLYTLLTGISWTAAVAALQDAAARANYRGRAMALQGFLCTAIGMGAGPYAVARISDHLSADGRGLSVALALFCVPTLLLGSTALLFAWRRSRDV